MGRYGVLSFLFVSSGMITSSEIWMEYLLYVVWMLMCICYGWIGLSVSVHFDCFMLA